MKKVILFGIILIALSTFGCITLQFDMPDEIEYDKIVSNIDILLNITENHDYEERFIFSEGSNRHFKSNLPIKQYYLDNLLYRFRTLGFNLTSDANIQINVEIQNSEVQLSSVAMGDVVVKLESKVEIENIDTSEILFSNIIKTRDSVKVVNGASSPMVAEELFPGVMTEHLDEIISDITTEELLQTFADNNIVKEKTSNSKTERFPNRDYLPIVTVFDFEYEGISEMEAGVLIDFLSGALLDTGDFRVIDRTQREVILSEIQFSLSGCTDESCQLEAGKLLAADYMVIGSLGKVGTRFVVNVKLIDVEKGETIISGRQLYANVDSMLDGCDELAMQLTMF